MLTTAYFHSVFRSFHTFYNDYCASVTPPNPQGDSRPQLKQVGHMAISHNQQGTSQYAATMPRCASQGLPGAWSQSGLTVCPH